MQLALIGILDDGWAGLSEAARTALKKSDLILGVGRTLELIRPHLSSSETLIKSDPFGLSLSKPLLLQEMPFDRPRANGINQCFRGVACRCLALDLRDQLLSGMNASFPLSSISPRQASGSAEPVHRAPDRC